MLSDHNRGFRWHLAKKLAFSLVFSPIPRDQGGHRFDWKEFIFFFRYLPDLMHNLNLLLNTGRELLLDSVIIVSFNKLELLLQGKQCGG